MQIQALVIDTDGTQRLETDEVPEDWYEPAEDVSQAGE